MAHSKLMSLEAAAALVADGSVITIGGAQITRLPSALLRELARQGRRGLRLYKPPSGYDTDLLSAAGVLAFTAGGVVSLDRFGLAVNHRRAVERGTIQHVEHT
jgi:glutaconate CoA-transferase, subunit A